LARNIKNKLDINDCSLAHLTLILLLHYLVMTYVFVGRHQSVCCSDVQTFNDDDDKGDDDVLQYTRELSVACSRITVDDLMLEGYSANNYTHSLSLMSSASFRERFSDSRSCWVVFIHIV